MKQEPNNRNKTAMQKRSIADQTHDQFGREIDTTKVASLMPPLQFGRTKQMPGSLTPPPFQLKADTTDLERGSERPRKDSGEIKPFRFENTVHANTPTPQFKKVEPYRLPTKQNGLPPQVQAKMETTMGQDFSNVNIHKESKEAESMLFATPYKMNTASTDEQGNPFRVNTPEFDPKRMRDELPEVNFENQGENDPKLREAMIALYGNPEGIALENALKTISEIRGMSLEGIQEQYKRMQEVKAGGERHYKRIKTGEETNTDFLSQLFPEEETNTDLFSQLFPEEEEEQEEEVAPLSPDLDLERHPEYTASLGQLRYGSIIGEIFDIDPVMGALLNPTGGIVGAGNNEIGDNSPDSNIGLHGIVHDAAGYLYNAHGIGPGYDYLVSDTASGNHLAGQLPGIHYWNENEQEDKKEKPQMK